MKGEVICKEIFGGGSRMKRWICIIMTLVLMAGGSVLTDRVFAAGLTTDRFDKAADITSNNN